LRFFISGEKKEILPDSKLWNFPLSGRKPDQPDKSDSGQIFLNSGFCGNNNSNSAKQYHICTEQDDEKQIKLNKNAENREITIGDYFIAAESFLSRHDFLHLITGIESGYRRPDKKHETVKSHNLLKDSVQKNRIRDVKIFLEKHGAFYHPMKIVVNLNNDNTCFFVLNGAVSVPGLSLIEAEYRLISRLNSTFSEQYLPYVYAMDFIETSKNQIAFFLGEWFEGYKEFHITTDRGQKQIALWESDGTCQYISEHRALSLYKEISRILTYYYNIETFEQISLWHHAAGDFIVKEEKNRFKIRLITARGYYPVTEFSSDEKQRKDHILPSLLIFFMQLSLKIRIDRLNGQGDYTLLGNEVIVVTADGFLEALDEKTDNYSYGDLKNIFIGFFKQFSYDQLVNIVENLAESEEYNDIERRLIIENSETHCRILQSIFQKF
jgi:hypothetical protein